MNLHSQEVKRRWLHHPPLPRLFSMRQSFLTIPIFGWFSGLPGSLFKWTQLYHCPYLCPLVDSWSLPLLPVSHANYITTCTPAIIFVTEIKVRRLDPQPPVCSPVSSAASPGDYPFPRMPTLCGVHRRSPLLGSLLFTLPLLISSVPVSYVHSGI